MTIEDNDSAVRSGQEDPGRRRLLALLGVAAGSLIAILAGLPVIGYIVLPVTRKMHRQWVSVGPVDRFPVGDTVLVSFENPSATPWAGVSGKTGAWVRRGGDSNFIAFVLNCSHLGCPVRWEASPKLFICPCHGSVYYEDGTVAAGPAPFPLQRFQVRVRGGNVELQSRPIPITEGT
ncbi:MAG: Rieske 2Fe-2S domain-containing protein [Syntrophobacteraceae bacterium]|nr:Rieske 2Fe-2S domain-containing protein [Syntrophobacteraceae bacterium]